MHLRWQHKIEAPQRLAECRFSLTFLLKFSSIQTITVGTVVSTVPPEGYPCRVADFTASGDFHPAPEILTLAKIRKIFCGCTPTGTFWWNSSTLTGTNHHQNVPHCTNSPIPGTKKPRNVPKRTPRGFSSMHCCQPATFPLLNY